MFRRLGKIAAKPALVLRAATAMLQSHNAGGLFSGDGAAMTANATA
jgi:hypothetical protein